LSVCYDDDVSASHKRLD